MTVSTELKRELKECVQSREELASTERILAKCALVSGVFLAAVAVATIFSTNNVYGVATLFGGALASEGYALSRIYTIQDQTNKAKMFQLLLEGREPRNDAEKEAMQKGVRFCDESLGEMREVFVESLSDKTQQTIQNIDVLREQLLALDRDCNIYALAERI